MIFTFFFNVFTKQYNATLSSLRFNVPFKITMTMDLSRYVKKRKKWTLIE